VANILSCPTCAAVIVPQEAGEVCPKCRTPLPQSQIETVMPQDLAGTDHATHRPRGVGSTPSLTSSGAPDHRSRDRGPKDSRPSSSGGSGGSSGWLSSSGAIDHGRFEPGTVLGGRYRIVERVGRGGMGEVYRADDLKLGQPVALKFLPPDVDRDPARLTQLHTEVRMARQVSHPNVCRVYDIDEIDGATFLSMEYVDGEDMASLLRRIGRFPEDRALEIARQICAGLAAAHERDVIHRDLKPANVMLDGTGRVRITDFGLAGASGEALRAGTPAYMAPEQLSGGDVTARSDIYSLGLVLYEIFTGQRALEGKNLAELIHKREQSGILPPMAIVKTLDPKIELAIMRCLKPQIGDRPASAMAVAAALPGGDPLAAALAAGETPSPDMVAAAGHTDALHPAIGLALLVTIVAGLLAYAGLADRQLLFARAPMQRSLDSLDDRAREIGASLGYPAKPTDTARGLRVDYEYLQYIARTNRTPNRWDDLATAPKGPMEFWQRGSPEMLVPLSGAWAPSFYDPPMGVPGMTRTVLNDEGRLLEFEAVPPRGDAPVQPGSPAKPDPWPALFAAAGLPMTQFQSVEPIWLPRVYASQRAAWEGPLGEGHPMKVRVEAAAHRGLPVYFKITGPWSPAPLSAQTSASTNRRFWQVTANVLGSVLLVAILLLARSNLRAGRGDRRGAARIFFFTLAVWFAAWLVGARHYSTFQIEDDRFFEFFAHALLNTSIAWLLYVALEPYVRRFSPGILISWTRVLSGQIVDSRVGRDILVGVTVGVGVVLLGLSYTVIVPMLLGDPPGTPRTTNMQFLLGARTAVGAVLRMIPNALQNAMFVAVAFGFGRALSRSVWGGALVAAALLTIFVLGESSSEHFLITLVFVAAFVVPMVATLLYAGLLATAIAFLVNQSINNSPIAFDPSLPHASGAFWTILLVAGLAAFGFYTSRGGQPLFGRLVQSD
jgi:serine/threonine protein kinase